MSSQVVQVLIRRQDDGYLAECVEYPVGCEADSLSQAMSRAEEVVRSYLERRGEEGAFLMLASYYYGRFSIAEF